MMFFKKYRIKKLTKKVTQYQQHRLTQQVADAAIKKEVQLYHQLHQLYSTLIGHKRYPFALEMAREMLRFAAQLNDGAAQYTLGLAYLEEAKWRDQLQRDKTFASAANEKKMKDLYEEAVSFLSAGSEASFLAKRMLGACYIFGWGVPQNQDKGLALVVDSITIENKWDKAAHIFASLGLNQPEFYEALVKHKG